MGIRSAFYQKKIYENELCILGTTGDDSNGRAILGWMFILKLVNLVLRKLL